MYSNNILNFQESMTILNACTKNIWKLIEFTAYIYIYMYVCVCVLAHCSWGWPEVSLFNSYYIEVYGKSLHLSQDWSTYPWSIPYNAMLTISWVFGMTRPGIELQSLGPLANALTILLINLHIQLYICIYIFIYIYIYVYV